MPKKLTKSGNYRGRKPKGVDGNITPMPQARRIPDLSNLDIVIAYQARRPRQISEWLEKGFDTDGTLRASSKEPSPLVEWLAENLPAKSTEKTADEYDRREGRVRRRLQRVWRYLGLNN